MRLPMSRRNFLQVVGGASLSTLLAGCFGVGGAQSSTGGNSNARNITIWDVRGGKKKILVNQWTAQFNKSHPDVNATVDFFVGDSYKQKIQIAIGQHQAPDIFFGWGGGVLKSYVDAGAIYDLTPAFDADPTWKDRYFPSVLASVTFNGKIYAAPTDGVGPTVFYYNKEIFAKYQLTAPQTWNELLQVVATLKKNNLIPIALAGLEKWPEMLYPMYLVDRLGGPSAFDGVLAKTPNAWSHPAILKACTMIQQLVDAGAFGTSFASTSVDTSQDQALLYTGKAGMLLSASSTYTALLANSPSFMEQGKLGWFAFPTIEGGAGDSANVAGGVNNFYSITTTSKYPQDCVTYLKDAVLNSDDIATYLTLGVVPPVKGIESQLASAPHSDWLQFLYKLTQDAPHYQLAWDQALPATQVQAMLNNVSQVFLKLMTPQQFADSMNQTLTL
jgi:raffinose/stachyose/melibiose transport system substrate-binding protein